MESRRLFLAIALSILVIVGWQFLMGPPPSTRPPGSETPVVDSGGEPSGREERSPGAQGSGTAAEPSEAAAEGSDPESVAERPPETNVEAPSGEPPIEGTAEERVTLETERVQIELSSRGGQLVSFLLKEHGSRAGGPVDLVRARSEGPYPFGLTDSQGGSHPLNEALFQTERLREGGDLVGVRFRYRGAAGDATKTFRFRGDPSAAVSDLLEVDIDLPGQDGWTVLVGPGIRNPSSQEQEESYFARRRALYSVGGEIEKLDATDLAQTLPVPAPGLRWVGLDDNYFLAALLFDPRQAAHGAAIFEPVLLLPGEDGATFEPVADVELLAEDRQDLEREVRVRIEPNAGRFQTLAYWGAKRLEVLSDLTLPGTGGAIPAQLDHTIELSFLRILAVPMLLGLHWIYQNVVANYGWAIVLMTLVLKLLLLPLTHKSYVSMRKMQELQPKMEALRARYRPKLKDKQGRPNMEAQRKMNEEMMALFKAEGVNPAGGCLPMLLQMPFFFAFYFILREAVELRNAVWLWVPDLSAPEPGAMHWLPVIMTVTQFLQQRMTPMAGDAMQRRLFQLLPFLFLVLFWGMPSGLVLYWLTNNVLTIGQQSIYNHLKKRGADSAEGSSKKTGGKKTRRAQAK